jgi:hypothetical protein
VIGCATACGRTPKDNGQFHGGGKSAWTLSNPMNIKPDKTAGWQQVRFHLPRRRQHEPLPGERLLDRPADAV